MGRTVPSFRMSIEHERRTYSAYRSSLGEHNQEAFDRLFDQARANCMAAGNAVRPFVFQGVFMAVVLGHEKRLAEMSKGLKELKRELYPPAKEPWAGMYAKWD